MKTYHMNDNLQISKGKKNKLFQFFFQNYNHYDSTTNKKLNSDIPHTLNTPNNQTSFKLNSTQSSCIRNQSFDNVQLQDSIFRAMKHRGFTKTLSNFKENEIPKLKFENSTMKKNESTKEIAVTKLKQHESNEDIKKNPIIMKVNPLTKKNDKFQDYLQYLTETGTRDSLDKSLWKTMVFKNKKLEGIDSQSSLDIFNIFGQDEKRPSFLKELNYRLHYKNKVPKTKSLKHNPDKMKEIIIDSFDGKKKKKKMSENKFESQKGGKSSILKINLNQNLLKNPDSLASMTKYQDNSTLPSDERTRFYQCPMILIQSISDLLKHFKSYSEGKLFYTTIEQIIGNSLSLKKSLLDEKNFKLKEPLSPRSLYMRFMMNEKSDFKSINTDKGKLNTLMNPRKKTTKLNSLFFSNPFKKISKETISLLIEFNKKLEERKIASEKIKMDNFKKSILTEHKNILEEQLKLMERLKKSNKKELYSKVKEEFLDRNNLNITVPNSDLNKQLKKLGKLKYIKTDNIANLQNFEQFLYEMKSSEMVLNDM